MLQPFSADLTEESIEKNLSVSDMSFSLRAFILMMNFTSKNPAVY